MSRQRHETTVGLFVILGFILLTLIVFFISGVYLFRPGYALNVMYGYVSILDKGAPVRMAGVRVGEVSEVRLLYDKEEESTRVRVKVFIEKGVEIRENYLFKIQGTHILSEPHIEITPEKGDAPILPNGALIEGVTPIPVETLIDNAQNIMEQLNAILTKVREAVEDEETTKALKSMVLNLSTISESINKVLSGSEGDLKGTLTDIKSSAESLDVILTHVKDGEGTLGQLLMKDELYKELQAFVKEIKTHPWRLMKRDNERKRFLYLF